jgi:hypothetical protein
MDAEKEKMESQTMRKWWMRAAILMVAFAPALLVLGSMSLLNYAVGISLFPAFIGAGFSLMVSLPNAANTWIRMGRP